MGRTWDTLRYILAFVFRLFVLRPNKWFSKTNNKLTGWQNKLKWDLGHSEAHRAFGISTICASPQKWLFKTDNNLTGWPNELKWNLGHVEARLGFGISPICAPRQKATFQNKLGHLEAHLGFGISIICVPLQKVTFQDKQQLDRMTKRAQMGLGRLSVQVLCQAAPLIISRARKRNIVFLARNMNIFAKTLVF